MYLVIIHQLTISLEERPTMLPLISLRSNVTTVAGVFHAITRNVYLWNFCNSVPLTLQDKCRNVICLTLYLHHSSPHTRSKFKFLICWCDGVHFGSLRVLIIGNYVPKMKVLEIIRLFSRTRCVGGKTYQQHALIFCTPHIRVCSRANKKKLIIHKHTEVHFLAHYLASSTLLNRVPTLLLDRLPWKYVNANKRNRRATSAVRTVPNVNNHEQMEDIYHEITKKKYWTKKEKGYWQNKYLHFRKIKRFNTSLFKSVKSFGKFYSFKLSTQITLVSAYIYFGW
jgi:hypothetical protein